MISLTDSEKSIFKKFSNNLGFYFSELLEYPFVKPHWIYISLSHKCTYECKMCGVVKILHGHDLDTSLVKRLLDEIALLNSESVVLFTGGEVFLRKDAFEIINHGVRQGLTIEAVSNGSLIDQALAKKIVESGLSNIAVSLDGAKEATHDLIRQKGAYKKALNALRFLADAKRQKGSGPQISMWVTIMRENVDELFDIIALAKDLGVECLVYHPVIVGQDDMQNTSTDAPFWIRGKDLEILKDQIDKIVKFQSENGLISFLHDPYLWINYFQGNITKSQWKCNPFVFTNIGPDGQMRSCGDSFGNIKELGFNDCLHTSQAQEARKIMKNCSKPCLQTCWAHPDSDSLAKIVSNFVKDIKGSPHKVELLKEALELIEEYEKKIPTG